MSRSFFLFILLSLITSSIYASDYSFQLPYEYGKKVLITNLKSSDYHKTIDYAMDFSNGEQWDALSVADGVVKSVNYASCGADYKDQCSWSGCEKKPNSIYKDGAMSSSVTIHHDDNLTCAKYLHFRCTTPQIALGKIAKGQFVGIVGNTGDSSGLHLHIELGKIQNGVCYTKTGVFAGDQLSFEVKGGGKVNLSALKENEKWASNNKKDYDISLSYIADDGFIDYGGISVLGNKKTGDLKIVYKNNSNNTIDFKPSVLSVPALGYHGDNFVSTKVNSNSSVEQFLPIYTSPDGINLGGELKPLDTSLSVKFSVSYNEKHEEFFKSIPSSKNQIFYPKDNKIFFKAKGEDDGQGRTVWKVNDSLSKAGRYIAYVFSEEKTSLVGIIHKTNKVKSIKKDGYTLSFDKKEVIGDISILDVGFFDNMQPINGERIYVFTPQTIENSINAKNTWLVGRLLNQGELIKDADVANKYHYPYLQCMSGLLQENKINIKLNDIGNFEPSKKASRQEFINLAMAFYLFYNGEFLGRDMTDSDIDLKYPYLASDANLDKLQDSERTKLIDNDKKIGYLKFNDINYQNKQYGLFDFIGKRCIITGYSQDSCSGGFADEACDIIKTKDRWFCPTKEITRAEVIKLISEVFFKKTATMTCNPRFSDVKKEDWYCKYVTYMTDKKIVTFNPDKPEFRPNAAITKIEAVIMLSRVNKLYSGGDLCSIEAAE